MSKQLCHAVPAPSRAPGLLAAALWALGCAHDAPSEPGHPPIIEYPSTDTVTTPPRDPVLEQTLPPPREPPPSICASGCPAPFHLDLESQAPWPPGTYFLRVELDGGAAQVCSVVFEPVFGAAHDDCREAGFSVAYSDHAGARRIDSVEFWSVQHEVHVELLTAEGAPRLVDVRHELVWRGTSGGCGGGCSTALPLTASVLETWASPPDAGAAPDAAANAADDAGSSADSGGPE